MRRGARSVGTAAFLAISGLFPLAAFSAEEQQPYRIGFHVLTTASDPSIDEHTLYIDYDGPIEFPMAENLLEIWSEARGKFGTVVLDLNSDGGELDHTEKVVALLKEIRGDVALETLVVHGNRCLSACVLVFVQGDQRVAGNCTSWMFHGPMRMLAKAPSPDATQRYLNVLRDRGVSEPFLTFLVEQNYLNRPGGYWVSAYELSDVHHAGIITRMLEPWQSEITTPPPFDPQLRRR